MPLTASPMKILSIVVHLSVLRVAGSHSYIGSTIKVTDTYEIRFTRNMIVIFEIAGRESSLLSRDHIPQQYWPADR